MKFPVRPDGTLEVKNPVQLPEVLDLLIVGGGPAGMAAALRALELGLQALVIDRDDLMSRIRDYSKDKLIYPHYGGGDRMRFPKAGDLVAQIPFAPIDKDDLCRRWKGLFYQHNLAAKVGHELLGLEGRDGAWKARVYNHNDKSEQLFKARHVAIAIGRGVPRTFDIPGNTLGVNYRLSDPDLFVQGPVCVIGGGTSAAEAVIALSRAKVQAAETSSVYWSYRGEKMPRVSKALQEEFFEAFVINGNIRYCPRSEPAAIVVAEDHQEYFSLRTDRRRLEGRPCETSHLEFPKEQVIACIGQDLPEKLLNSMDIFMGEEGKKKLMLVRPVLETQQPSVYLIGDILSQYYFSTEDFKADPSGYQRIRHPGNIKSAVRDGVYIADVVANRLKGGTGLAVVIADLEEEESGPEALEQPVAPRPADEISQIVRLEEVAPAVLIRVLPGGIEDSEHPVPSDGALTIGRSGCDLSFADDELISERHASISPGAKGFLLRDDGSRNGVFFQLVPGKPREVFAGDLISLARQFLLMGEDEKGSFFSHYDQSGKEIGRHSLSEEPLILGRQSPDVTLDRTDKTLSRRHLTLALKQQSVLATDLNSSNGTYLKIRDALLLEHDDRFRAGQQQFLFQLRDKGPRQRRYAQPVPEKGAAAEGTPSPAAAAPSDGQGSVTFEGLGKTCPLQGQTISRAAEEHGVEIDVECEMGLCGLDPIRIVSGQEHLNPCGEQEAEALRKKGLEPGQYRFACVARASGPVVVEILEQ
ncbi:MAG: FHA domain-containing protein [Acidobacteriota bacterium]